MRLKFTLSVVVLTLLAGCQITRSNDEEMYRLASALTKLSAAAEATVRYENPPAGISEEELLRLATQHDPALLKPFESYFVRVLSRDRHAIVLVCTKDKGQGLLEDAGCSARLDVHLWQAQPPKSCNFTVKVEEVCTAQ